MENKQKKTIFVTIIYIILFPKEQKKERDNGKIKHIHTKKEMLVCENCG